MRKRGGGAGGGQLLRRRSTTASDDWLRDRTVRTDRMPFPKAMHKAARHAGRGMGGGGGGGGGGVECIEGRCMRVKLSRRTESAPFFTRGMAMAHLPYDYYNEIQERAAACIAQACVRF